MSTLERTRDPRRRSFALFLLSIVGALYVLYGYGVYRIIVLIA